MANDARENYRAVFGVYPNEPKQAKAEPLDTQKALDFALTMESAANNLASMWAKSHLAGISDRAQDLLRQIQGATTALRQEIDKTGLSDTAISPAS